MKKGFALLLSAGAAFGVLFAVSKRRKQRNVEDEGGSNQSDSESLYDKDQVPDGIVCERYEK